MSTTSTATIHAAIYARVSSDQQAQEQTIESQVAALRERVASDGLALDEELCFLDDGVSGSTLMRPALERLRDLAYVGGFQKLYVHSPDRLARRYAYQVLLVDELQEARRGDRVPQPGDRCQPGRRPAAADARHVRRIRTREDHGTQSAWQASCGTSWQCQRVVGGTLWLSLRLASAMAAARRPMRSTTSKRRW